MIKTIYKHIQLSIQYLNNRPIIYAFVPSLLLIIICFVQIYLSNFSVLTPWKGGGFGMFSSVNNRFIHMHLYDKDKFYCSDVPNSLKRNRRQMENFPTQRLLKNYASQMISRPWVKKTYYLSDGSITERARIVEDYERIWNQNDSIYFDALSIEIYDYEFNGITGQLDIQKIKEYRLDK